MVFEGSQIKLFGLFSIVAVLSHFSRRQFTNLAKFSDLKNIAPFGTEFALFFVFSYKIGLLSLSVVTPNLLANSACPALMSQNFARSEKVRKQSEFPVRACKTLFEVPPTLIGMMGFNCSRASSICL